MEMSIHGVLLSQDDGQFSTDKVRQGLETRIALGEWLARCACDTVDADREIYNVAILDGAERDGRYHFFLYHLFCNG